MTDFTQATVTELAKLYQSGAVSPVTVAEQVLAKIQKLNPTLNAFCFVDPDTTMQQAQASEQRWQKSQPLSAVDGVPVAVKDLLLVRGWPMLKGSLAVDADQPWLEDSPAVSSLRDAGTVFVGKTTTSEFGSKLSTDSLLNGPTHNPWNISYTPGGSSGGSAVAVSSGMVPCALGTDYTGSVIVPAAFCGVTGFKPTYGLLPGSADCLFECSHVGCFAHSASDLALLLNIKLANLNISSLRVAYCIDLGFGKNVNHEIALAVEQVAQQLARLGARVTEVTNIVDDPVHVASEMFLAEMHQQWNMLDQSQQQLTDHAFQAWAHQGSQISQRRMTQLKLQQLQLKKQMHSFMKSYDVILCASTTVTADAFDPTALATDILLSYLFNLTHQPCVTVPVGVNQHSMPIGVLIAGATGADAKVLETAHAVESMFPMPICPVIL
jgi:aspartyl-tRNA(Asn)/glutamyl-tRNA(Gln) amidotransferase subunit A